MMIRRDFRNSLVIAGSALSLGREPTRSRPRSLPDRPADASHFGIHRQHKDEDIPEDAHARQKSMLDGFGLALAGSVSDMGPLIRQYLKTLGFVGGMPASSGQV
jgi:hypothetical protein